MQWIEFYIDVIEKKCHSFDSIKAVAEFVEKETGMDKIQLFCEKERAKEKSCLGHLCLEGPCKLFAVEKKDKDRKKAYFERR